MPINSMETLGLSFQLNLGPAGILIRLQTNDAPWVILAGSSVWTDESSVCAPSAHLAGGDACLARLRDGHDPVAVGGYLVYVVKMRHVTRLTLLYAF